jgi:carbon storage regulator
MLVLSRSRFEEILIENGDDLIRLSVVEIKGDRVRLGIEAPAHIRIARSEIFEATRKRARQETDYVCHTDAMADEATRLIDGTFVVTYTDEVTKINTEPSGDLFRSPGVEGENGSL